ncbi:MAG: hypothetical protein AAB921_03970 [Patescibacteria group bacterium]
MSKFWMMILAIIALVWVGGYATDASAKTNEQIRDCVDQRFAMAPFTGTLAQKEEQARQLPANKPFGNPQITLPQGGTLWGYCETLPAPAAATTKVANLGVADGALKREVTRLEGLAYETINARDRNGFIADGNTWQGHAATLKGELDTANDKVDSTFLIALCLGLLAVFLGICLVLLGRALISNKASLKKARTALENSEFNLEILRGKMASTQPEVPTPPSGDANLDAPTAPEAASAPEATPEPVAEAPAPATETAPEAPTPQPEVPEFLERLKK